MSYRSKRDGNEPNQTPTPSMLQQSQVLNKSLGKAKNVSTNANVDDPIESLSDQFKTVSVELNGRIDEVRKYISTINASIVKLSGDDQYKNRFGTLTHYENVIHTIAKDFDRYMITEKVVKTNKIQEFLEKLKALHAKISTLTNSVSNRKRSTFKTVTDPTTPNRSEQNEPKKIGGDEKQMPNTQELNTSSTIELTEQIRDEQKQTNQESNTISTETKQPVESTPITEKNQNSNIKPGIVNNERQIIRENDIKLSSYVIEEAKILKNLSFDEQIAYQLARIEEQKALLNDPTLLPNALTSQTIRENIQLEKQNNARVEGERILSNEDRVKQEGIANKFKRNQELAAKAESERLHKIEQQRVNIEEQNKKYDIITAESKINEEKRVENDRIQAEELKNSDKQHRNDTKKEIERLNEKNQFIINDSHERFSRIGNQAVVDKAKQFFKPQEFDPDSYGKSPEFNSDLVKGIFFQVLQFLYDATNDTFKKNYASIYECLNDDDWFEKFMDTSGFLSVMMEYIYSKDKQIIDFEFVLKQLYQHPENITRVVDLDESNIADYQKDIGEALLIKLIPPINLLDDTESSIIIPQNVTSNNKDVQLIGYVIGTNDNNQEFYYVNISKDKLIIYINQKLVHLHQINNNDPLSSLKSYSIDYLKPYIQENLNTKPILKYACYSTIEEQQLRISIDTIHFTEDVPYIQKAIWAFIQNVIPDVDFNSDYINGYQNEPDFFNPIEYPIDYSKKTGIGDIFMQVINKLTNINYGNNIVLKYDETNKLNIKRNKVLTYKEYPKLVVIDFTNNKQESVLYRLKLDYKINSDEYGIYVMNGIIVKSKNGDIKYINQEPTNDSNVTFGNLKSEILLICYKFENVYKEPKTEPKPDTTNQSVESKKLKDADSAKLKNLKDVNNTGKREDPKNIEPVTKIPVKPENVATIEIDTTPTNEIDTKVKNLELIYATWIGIFRSIELKDMRAFPPISENIVNYLEEFMQNKKSFNLPDEFLKDEMDGIEYKADEILIKNINKFAAIEHDSRICFKLNAATSEIISNVKDKKMERYPLIINVDTKQTKLDLLDKYVKINEFMSYKDNSIAYECVGFILSYNDNKFKQYNFVYRQKDNTWITYQYNKYFINLASIDNLMKICQVVRFMYKKIQLPFVISPLTKANLKIRNGLHNNAENLCFANSLLQGIIRNEYAMETYIKMNERPNVDVNIQYWLFRVFDYLFNAKNNITTTSTEYINNINKLIKKRGFGEMYDAGEFMEDMFTSISESQASTGFINLYKMKYKTYFKCNTCNIETPQDNGRETIAYRYNIKYTHIEDNMNKIEDIFSRQTQDYCLSQQCKKDDKGQLRTGTIRLESDVSELPKVFCMEFDPVVDNDNIGIQHISKETYNKVLNLYAMINNTTKLDIGTLMGTGKSINYKLCGFVYYLNNIHYQYVELSDDDLYIYNDLDVTKDKVNKFQRFSEKDKSYPRILIWEREIEQPKEIINAVYSETIPQNMSTPADEATNDIPNKDDETTKIPNEDGEKTKIPSKDDEKTEEIANTEDAKNKAISRKDDATNKEIPSTEAIPIKDDDENETEATTGKISSSEEKSSSDSDEDEELSLRASDESYVHVDEFHSEPPPDEPLFGAAPDDVVDLKEIPVKYHKFDKHIDPSKEFKLEQKDKSSYFKAVNLREVEVKLSEKTAKINNHLDNVFLNDKVRRREKIVKAVNRARLESKSDVEIEQFLPGKLNEFLLKLVDHCGQADEFNNAYNNITNYGTYKDLRLKIKNTMFEHTLDFMENVKINNDDEFINRLKYINDLLDLKTFDKKVNLETMNILIQNINVLYISSIPLIKTIKSKIGCKIDYESDSDNSIENCENRGIHKNGYILCGNLNPLNFIEDILNHITMRKYQILCCMYHYQKIIMAPQLEIVTSLRDSNYKYQLLHVTNSKIQNITVNNFEKTYEHYKTQLNVIRETLERYAIDNLTPFQMFQLFNYDEVTKEFKEYTVNSNKYKLHYVKHGLISNVTKVPVPMTPIDVEKLFQINSSDIVEELHKFNNNVLDATDIYLNFKF